ncbi:Elongator subunit elp2 [Ophidiomyces ophidiicola]|nr:Elongator subunit elp2 [Ophidiomyces ophidiicola]KAI1962348.1 Elongator subunit elp2 [Ophidiomyces ophidiicola]
MVSFNTQYISVGGNRHPAAADWDQLSGLVAYGAHDNVALWDPADPYHRGVHALLVGHTDKVNAIRFCTPLNGDSKTPLLISGSTDRNIKIWRPDTNFRTFTLATTLQGHENSINCIACARGSDIFVSGAADGTIKTWAIDTKGLEAISATLVDTITLKPHYFPLALALRKLDGGQLVLAVGGTRSIVQIFVAQNSSKFELKATLTGHEGWIRALAFTDVNLPESEDFLLASGSQDKYIRLWRVHPGDTASSVSTSAEGPILGAVDHTLSNKAHSFEVARTKYSITFEALLFGHEDWIYSIAWNPNSQRPQLMSSSADNSLVIWECDAVSGVWFSGSRMGEISAQKGSTTATGSAGGFWIGLWSPDGNRVICLGRTGSWRSWEYKSDADAWAQVLGITGHVRSVNDAVWEPSGGYLLSTSGDQTTRLHAPWQHNSHCSWHEFSRPQIHGYDLNCLASLGPRRFVSGADEKLLRVFSETKSIALLLEQLSGFKQASQDEMAEAANIPVLGLSNKAVDESDINSENDNETNGVEGEAPRPVIQLDLHRPPLEDHLARHTLWPEHEKLYGHGYEISAVTASNDRLLIATACKASSIDHAVIRLYNAETWREIRPPLTAHSLTITSLQFSSDDQFLLSVGRDRQWAIFKRDVSDKMAYKLWTSNLKAHSRMILSANWAPHPTGVFATAGRDRSVKIWAREETTFVYKCTIAVPHPVTAIDFLPKIVEGRLCLAIGDDTGRVMLHEISSDSFTPGKSAEIPKSESPSRAITRLSWRPISIANEDSKTDLYQIAVASEDSSVRVYDVWGFPR